MIKICKILKILTIMKKQNKQRRRKNYNDSEHTKYDLYRGSLVCFLFILIGQHPCLVLFFIKFYLFFFSFVPFVFYYPMAKHIPLSWFMWSWSKATYKNKQNMNKIHRITSSFGYIGKSHNNHQNEKIGFQACT